MRFTPTQALTAAAAVVFSLFGIAPAVALKAGDRAPDFTSRSVLNGKAVEFNLRDALKQHAVVLYFFPQAFSAG